MKMMKNALVILAGGLGSRFGDKIPKQFIKINNYNFIEYFLNNINIDYFDIIVIACEAKYRKKYFNKINNLKKKVKIIYSNPGKTRKISSFEALKKIKQYNPKNVLIHDSARPLCSNDLIKRIISNLSNNETAIPYIINNDRKLSSNNNEIISNIKYIQTPQGFKFDLIYKKHLKTKNIFYKDDSSLLNSNKIHFIKGENSNLKITFKNDLSFFKVMQKKIFKHGIGYDIHKFNFKIKKGLKLCGAKIDYYKLVGHSDADVGIHAICDSIFGALSMKDIGYYFSNKDLKWKNSNSKIFLNFAKEKLKENNFFIVNLDINFICEKPNISKYRNKMISNIADLLEIPKKIISIKATSNEKLGFIGEGLGIAAESIVQISNEKFY